MEPEIRKGFMVILDILNRGQAVLVVNKYATKADIPDIHNFYPKKYYKSIRHLGFGFFEGRTEHGTFSFDGGGAMRHIQGEKEWISWTPLRVENEKVLEDLGYNIEVVKERVRNILS